MQALLILALLSIAAILFYREVERSHKILVAKVALGIAVIAGIALAIPAA